MKHNTKYCLLESTGQLIRGQSLLQRQNRVIVELGGRGARGSVGQQVAEGTESNTQLSKGS